MHVKRRHTTNIQYRSQIDPLVTPLSRTSVNLHLVRALRLNTTPTLLLFLLTTLPVTLTTLVTIVVTTLALLITINRLLLVCWLWDLLQSPVLLMVLLVLKPWLLWMMDKSSLPLLWLDLQRMLFWAKFWRRMVNLQFLLLLSRSNISCFHSQSMVCTTTDTLSVLSNKRLLL